MQSNATLAPADMIAVDVWGCSPHMQPGRVRQAEETFCLSAQWCQLHLNPGRYVAQQCGSHNLAAAITSVKAKMQICKPAYPHSPPLTPITVAPGRVSGDALLSNQKLAASGYKEPVPETHIPRAPHHLSCLTMGVVLRHQRDLDTEVHLQTQRIQDISHTPGNTATPIS